MPSEKKIVLTESQLKDMFNSAMGRASAKIMESFNFVFDTMIKNETQLLQENISLTTQVAQYQEKYGRLPKKPTLNRKQRRALAKKNKKSKTK